MLTLCGTCEKPEVSYAFCYSSSKRRRAGDGVPSSAARDAAVDADADASSSVQTETQPPET